MRPRVLVVGGGVAGIAAACEAALRGAEVVVFERRPFLGGKAFSFRPGGGAEIDNGQHVFLGCCTAYRWLLGVLGSRSSTHLQPSFRMVVRDRAGRHGVLAASALPAPFHVGPSFARYPHLSAREKASALRALAALHVLRERDRQALDGVAFADWLSAHGQTQGAVARFWDLLVLPTCNDRSERVSAALAAYVFREGLMRTRSGAAIGYATVGLSQLVTPAAHRFLARHGGRIETDAHVVHADGRSVVGADGTRTEGDAVIVAVPPERAVEIAPSALATDPGLGVSPIVNVHVWYDRPVMVGHMLAVVDSAAQWIFNRTAIQGDGGPGQHLAVSISGARHEIAMPREAVARMIVDELEALFPNARADAVRDVHVVKEPRATFAAAPGQAARRPGPVTPDPTLFLAGNWTATRWPATMEGAARSGIVAARLATARGSVSLNPP